MQISTLPALMLDVTVVASESQVSAEMDGEIIILHAQSGLYFGLENVAALIWSLIQQPMNVRAICERVQAEYDVEPEKCHADVHSLILELLDEGLAVRV